jgi:hypothetical protein
LYIRERLEGWEGYMTKRLSCRIQETADKDLDRIIARRKSNKGRTIKYLMELAREAPEHPIQKFSGNDAQTSTYNAAEDWLDTFDEYRAMHGLYENTGFFKDALLRGMSIELARSPSKPKSSDS